MSWQIREGSMSNVIPVDPRPNLSAGGKPHAIVPQSMDEAYRLAKAVCMAGMAPKGMDTPEKAMIAIMRGLEVGMTPFQALDKIAIVNGRPTIWGDGAIGLVRGSGLCEYIKEWIEGDGDKRVAFCEAKRRGEPSSIVRKFGVADAKRAGLWGKQGPWQQYDERMMQMRARGFALRDGFADVLGGLYLREEIEEERIAAARDVTPMREPPPPMHSAAEPPAPAIEHKQSIQMEPIPARPEPVEVRQEPPAPREAKTVETRDPDRVVETFVEAAEAAQNSGDLFDAWQETVEPAKHTMIPADFEVCQAARESALKRLSK
jgi:hypothetical protein